MSSVTCRIIGPGCTRRTRDPRTGALHACGRPAREPGGTCTPCWIGLTATERRQLRWDTDQQPTDELDVIGITAGLALKAWVALPDAQPRRAA